MPNIQSIYSFVEIFIEFNYTSKYLFPPAVKVALVGVSGFFLAKYIYPRRQTRYFPLFMFLSGMVCFNFLDHAHAKHLLYLQTPLLVYGLITGREGEYFKAAA